MFYENCVHPCYRVVDGLIARPNDDIDWAFHYGTDSMAGEVVK